MKMSSWPYFSERERLAVDAVLRSGKVNYWTGGEGRAFEREFANATACAHGVAVANGTLALDLALKALDIGARDEVVTTPRSFMASASCIVNAGATPVFADVDRESQNITWESILAVITPRTRAVICVHLAGWPCEMDGIMALAAEYDLKVIEDCAQAHGATYYGQPVGSLGHAAAWSFCQDKIISTGGEGGMLTTNDASIWRRAWEYKDHGKGWDAVHRSDHPPGYRWLHESFGTNWRLTEMQAAIGRIQMRSLRSWVDARRRNAQRLQEVLHAFPSIRLSIPPEHIGHAYYRYYAFIRPENLREGWSRDRILAEISAEGVPCSIGSCPEIYRERAFPAARLQPPHPLPIAAELGQTSLAFLVHPTLTDFDLNRTCDVIHKVLTRASTT